MSTTLDPITVFDAYRRRYDSFNFADHREFYDLVAREHPDQIGFDLSLAGEFFRFVKPSTIIELGGWDGRMAHFLGAEINWRNYELADVPQLCEHPGYEVILDRWAWEDTLEADAFDASHVLEHLSTEHLNLLMGALECEWAYVEVPLGTAPIDWQGYWGSHVLPLSISEFDALWHLLGWKTVYGTRTSTGFVRFYRR